MKNTLVILGNFPQTRDLFDYNRTDCDIWAFNESMAFEFFKRADVIFQMHNPVIWRNPKNRNDANHYLWLTNQSGPCRSCSGKGKYTKESREVSCNSCKGTGVYTPAENRKDITVYMQDVYPEVLNSVKYPIDEIRTKYQTDYFSSSISYAVALGIHLGYKRIEIYGVGLATDTEYRYQRDGFTFWCGIAKGSGVELIYHGDIFDAPMYGYEGDVTLDYSLFADRITELEPKCKEALEKYDAAKAAITQAAELFIRTGNGYQEITAIAAEQIKLANEFGVTDGARQENIRYQKKADAMRSASGGEFIFSRQEFEQAGQAIFKERTSLGMKANNIAPQCEALLKMAATCKNAQKRKKRFQDFLQVYDQYMQLSVAVGMYTGALAENAAFLQTLDAHIKAAGGNKSEEVMLEALRRELQDVEVSR